MSNAVDVMSSQFAPKTGWRQKAPTKREALRALLERADANANGGWCSNFALSKVAGFRFGARLMELHRGDSFHYERRADEQDDSCVWYRKSTEEKCTVCQRGNSK